MSKRKILNIIFTIFIVMVWLTIIYGLLVVVGLAPILPVFIGVAIILTLLVVYALFDVWKD